MRVERVKGLIDQIRTVIEPLSSVKQETMEIQRDIQAQLASFAMSVNLKFRPEEIAAFQKRPYYLEPVPGRRDNWRLIVPRFIDIGAVGWIDDVLSNDSYNVFLINRYTEWLGEIPEEIKKQLGFKPTLKLELAGDELHGPRGDLEQAWGKYKPLLKSREDDKIKINPKRAFELIVSLVKDGILPFTPKPIPESDLMERPVDFDLRDYQKQAWEKLLQYSNIGVFFPASTGKTFQALYAMSRIRGPHLVVVPTRLLVEQWQDRIEVHTQLKPEDYVVTTYQSAIKRYATPPPPYTEWGLVIVDEVHHLPANHFSKLALIKRRCTLGLSASPNREDGREEYIFALTGYPVGLGWQYFRQLGIIRSPVCNVWLVRNFEAKINLLQDFLQTEKKTLIFSDSIDIGKTISKRFNIEHVWGETKERLSTLKDEKVVVISRVGDEGVSLPDIEQVIEVSWLYGSRRQQLQRFTRLLHGQTEKVGEHHILMTLEEYIHDRKRLFSVMDRGFKLVIHREGVSEETISKRLQSPVKPQVRKPKNEAREAESVLPVPDEGAIAGIMSLPGIQRTMATLTRPQQRLYELLLKNDGQYFKRSNLPLVLGYTSINSMRVTVNPSELVQKGLIETTRIEGETCYRTNIRARLGVS